MTIAARRRRRQRPLQLPRGAAGRDDDDGPRRSADQDGSSRAIDVRGKRGDLERGRAASGAA